MARKKKKKTEEKPGVIACYHGQGTICFGNASKGEELVELKAGENTLTEAQWERVKGHLLVAKVEEDVPGAEGA